MATGDEQHGLSKHQHAHGVALQKQAQDGGSLGLQASDLVVVGNGDDLQVVEQREQDDVEGLEAEVVEDGQGGQEEDDLHRDADAVDHVGLQPLEDAPRDLDGCVDG